MSMKYIGGSPVGQVNPVEMDTTAAYTFGTSTLLPISDTEALTITGTNLTSASAIDINLLAKMSGDVINIAMDTSVLTADTTVVDVTVANAHDGVAIDTLTGYDITWSGDVPQTVADSSMYIYAANYSGTWGSSGGQGGSLEMFRGELTGTVDGTGVNVYGLGIYGTSATWTNSQNTVMIGSNIGTGDNAATWSGNIIGTQHVFSLGNGTGNVSVSADFVGFYLNVALSAGAGTVTMNSSFTGALISVGAQPGTSFNGNVQGTYVRLDGAATTWGSAWTDRVYGAYYSINPTGTIVSSVIGAEYVLNYTRADPSDANTHEEGGVNIDATSMVVNGNAGGGTTTYYGFHFDSVGATLGGDNNYGIWTEMPVAYAAVNVAAFHATGNGNTMSLLSTDGGNSYGIDMTTSTTDVDNNVRDIRITTGITNTTAAVYANGGTAIQITIDSTQNTLGGTIDDTTTGIEISKALDETTGAIVSSGPLLSMLISTPAGTPTVYGDMVYLDISGTNDVADILRGYYFDSRITMDHNLAEFYGIDIDSTGMTVTDAATVMGIHINFDGITTPRNAAYVSGLTVSAPDGVDPAIDTNYRMSLSGRIEEGAYHWKDHFSGQVWMAQWATDGANNTGVLNQNPTSQLNGQVRLETNAAAAASIERHWGDKFCFDSNYHTVLEVIFTVKTLTADLGDFQLEFGLIDAAETSYARIIADYNNDTEWHVQSSAAGAGTMDAIAASETIAQDVRIKFRIEIVDNSIATGLRTFLGQDANPTLEATTDAVNEIPASGVMMQPYVKLTSRVGGGATAQIIDIDKCEVIQDLP